MSQGCWFVFMSIGIVVVFDVTILTKDIILATFVIVGRWIENY